MPLLGEWIQLFPLIFLEFCVCLLLVFPQLSGDPGCPTCSTDTSQSTGTAGLPMGPVTWAPFSDLAQAWFSFGTSEQRARLGVLFSEQISPGMGRGCSTTPDSRLAHALGELWEGVCADGGVPRRPVRQVAGTRHAR